VRIDAATRALVTGPSRGIGRALAEALAARGATLGLASRSGSELAALATGLPGDHHVLECDVGDRAQVEKAVHGFIEAAGGLELVVANAGIAHYGPLRTMPIEEIEQMTRVNWLGTVYLVKTALPFLLERCRGHIVIVSSGAGHRAFPWAAGYGATKAAQRGFGEALRHELAGTGVSVTTVFPGEIASSLHAGEETLPQWYRGGPDAAPASELATKVIEAVEADRRQLFYPRLVRALGAFNGVSPALADVFLRRLRGDTAAPRRR
jgi:3-oxoacyl-[acyl-carrier protein] reductase